MVPLPFDLQGGMPLCAARAVLVGASLSAFGALTFRSVVARKAYAHMAPELVASDRQRLLRIVQASTIIGLLAALAWLVLQAGYMADASGLADAVRAVPTVLARTAFGHVILAQIAGLALLLAAVGSDTRLWRSRAPLGLSALVLVLEAGHSHAYSMYGGPSILLASDVLHLLGAGAWLGGLLPLLVLVAWAPPKAGALAARWFSPLGQWCIAALVVSSAFQGWVLVATIPGLVGTAYGWLVLAKLSLFAVLLGFAAANRFRFAPALVRGEPERARGVLVRSILFQSGFALIIVVAAAVLSELPPAMHEQPVWLFPERFSLAAINEDPDFRREVMLAGLSLCGAAVLLIGALVARRFRIASGSLAALVAWLAIPHLDLLLVTAYPTSFYHSPTSFGASSIVTGQAVYKQQCVACHGIGGQGNGPAAKTLPVPPADLTAPHLWMHSDGELFWWLTDGMKTPEGVRVMPGFAAALDDDQRWAAIDFIRARNAGGTFKRTGDWTPSVQAPGFDITCATAAMRLKDLRGQFVLLRFGNPAAQAAGNVVTVTAPPGSTAAAGKTCVSHDETVPIAYAILSGLDTSAMADTEFLIDDQGLLRAMQRPGAADTWNDGASLQAELRMLRAHPASGVVKDSMPMNMPM